MRLAFTCARSDELFLWFFDSFEFGSFDFDPLLTLSDLLDLPDLDLDLYLMIWLLTPAWLTSTLSTLWFLILCSISIFAFFFLV